MMSETLSRAINEKDVENTYRQYFHKKFGKDFQVTSPFGCDGFGVSKVNKVRVLMEFKDNVNHNNITFYLGLVQIENPLLRGGLLGLVARKLKIVNIKKF